MAAWDHDAAERLAQIYRRYDVPDVRDALTVAAAMSVSPRDLVPDVTVHGHGVLALTSDGRKHGVPAGALPT